MNKQRTFRFGVIVYQTSSKDEWIARARKAESLGYSTFLVPDHFGDQFSPVPALVAAAKATTSLRIGSFVFDNDFRHPALLAKEAATIDVLSGGRFELGIGAGWLKAEYEQAGIPYEPGCIRTSKLEESLHVIKGLFAEGPVTFSGNYYTITGLEGYPKPIQRPHPPILIGGGGKRMLSIAAREANIVGIAPKVQTGGKLDVADSTAEATFQKIEWIRQVADNRFSELELNVIVFDVVVTDDRYQAAEKLAERLGSGLTREQVLEVPHLLIGTVDQICEDLWVRREHFGVSYISVFEESMEAFAPVVSRLAGK